MEVATFNQSLDNDTTWNHYYFNQPTDNDTAWDHHTLFYVSPNLFPFLKAFCILCYSITFIVGIVGNSLVIWIAGFKMKTVNALWFLNLAMADLMCSSFLPVRIAEWTLFKIFHYPQELCLVSSIVLVLSMCSSVYFLTVISVDRCVSAMWPIWTRVHRTLNMARVVSVITWVVAFILSTPIGIYYFEIDFSDCAPKDAQMAYATNRLVKSIRFIRLAFMFVLPFAIILISYGLIFYKMKKLIKRRSRQSYRMVITVVVCFFICWFPYYTWPFIYIGHVNFQLDNLINEIAICLAYFNSCINPVLYVLFSRDFKDNFFKSIPARMETAFSDRCEPQCGEDIGSETVQIDLRSI